MTSWDGVRLFYRAWIPTRPTERALLLLHRGHEHSGRWDDVVRTLGLDDVAVFAWDMRGHGRSDGPRGGAPDIPCIVKDLEWFTRHLGCNHAVRREDVVVMGHSVAAVVLAAWVHDYAPPIRGMILATPAFRVRLYVPGALPLLRLRQRALGPGVVRSYVKPRLLTHDRDQARRYDQDQLIFRQISVNVLIDLHDVAARVVADAAAIRTPALILTAKNDWVVDNAATVRFADRLSSPIKTVRSYAGFRHAIFHERDRLQPIGDVRRFVKACFSDRACPPPDTDPRACTLAEHDRLRDAGGWRYLPMRWALRSVGLLSEGIRLGWRTGFDSGTTLDYVYQNRPGGLTALGRLIDRAYLNSVGWRGIRQRRVHLESLLHEAIRRLHADGRRVHVVDIASGPGRYVLEVLRSAPWTTSALLRDVRPQHIEAGRRLAETLGVRDVRYETADAFDRQSLAEIRPRPTIAVASGLYELFPENDRVLTSLRGLADALEPDGYLVYTNQPWHPQIEFIARVLRNSNGERWVMRRRTQEEMDALVRAAGFQKLQMEIDPWGIFTVSLARRAA